MGRYGKRLIESAKQAAEIARGERKPAGVFIPADIDVKAIRLNTKMSQEDFAYSFGFTANQIKDWEQGRSRPLGGVRVYLLLIAENPKRVLDLVNAARRSQAKKAA